MTPTLDGPFTDSFLRDKVLPFEVNKFIQNILYVLELNVSYDNMNLLILTSPNLVPNINIYVGFSVK